MTTGFVNGKYVDIDSPTIVAGDIGFLRGYGVYEGITSYNGHPFHLKDHYERLQKSAGFLHINVPVSLEELDAILRELISKNNFPRTDFRLILTGGVSVEGIGFEKSSSTLAIIPQKHHDLPAEAYEHGVSVILDDFQRDCAEYKTLNYINAVRLQESRKEKSATEIIYHHEDKLLEASTSNVFIVKDKVVITPKDNILEGITRKLVLKLAKGVGLSVQEREVSMDEFYSADEVFITASFKEIVPVVKADDKMIGGGKVGPVTKTLIEAFKTFTQ